MATFTFAEVRGKQLAYEIEQATGLMVGTDYGVKGEHTLDIFLDLTPQQISDIQAVIDAHVPTYPFFPEEIEKEAERQRKADDQADWLATALAGRTPAQARTYVAEALADASTVGEVKAVLDQLLPLLAAGLVAVAHQVIEE